ncbi:MAG: hypothetical protein FJW38_11575 [Acidobacteria bacterium]|nr:hypothetical protein [Acidobacteriota bacterium]
MRCVSFPASTHRSSPSKVRRFYAALFALVLATRLCHSGIVWVEEGYALAAAREMLAGKTLYADIWFDKPPLFPGFYLLFGAMTGVPLRIAGALFVTLSAWSLGRFARSLWGETEERFAAAILAFFLTFGIPATVMVIGPDLMLIPLQAAGVLAAWRGNALAAGLVAGFGMLINGKMLFLLPACFVARPLWVAGFVAPQLILLPVAREYWLEVWAWGMMYSRDTFVTDAFGEGLKRTLNWIGFHVSIAAGAIFTLRTESNKRRWLLWIALAALAMIAGFRFFPRYYFLLLPPLVLLAARAASCRRWLICLLMIPLIRFGPRYVTLAADLVQGRPHQWADLAMEQDSRAAAQHIRGSLFVWGYRPEIYALAGRPAATMFLDSQPLTGVLADRHLTSSVPTAPNLAAENRAKLVQSNPDWIVDGLGPYNPKLAITEFPDLREWLVRYEEVQRTGGLIVYRRRP